jgi:hypothetical protein
MIAPSLPQRALNFGARFSRKAAMLARTSSLGSVVVTES